MPIKFFIPFLVLYNLNFPFVHIYVQQMGQRFLFVHVSCVGCFQGMRDWSGTGTSVLHRGYIVCVSKTPRIPEPHTNLSFQRYLVKRKVRWMRIADKLHFTTEKEAGGQGNNTEGPRAWICLTWLMIPANGGSYMSSMFKSLKASPWKNC